MAERGNRGASKLASILDGRMNERDEGRLDFDFGVIKSGLSLVCNGFPKPIAKDDYSVCRHLTGKSISGGNHSGHSSGNGSHSHTLPKLAVGDHVLVVWVNEEPVVVDVVVKASSI